MPAFERDPNALAIMLAGQSQLPRYTQEEEDLGSMIPEEQLFQAQEAIGEQGRRSGGAYAIPSREALRNSGVAELRRLFGIQQAQGEAKAMPAHVAGQYGMREARVKGEYDVESARQKAMADADRFQQQQDALDARQERGQTFQAGEGALTREALAGRQAAQQGATRGNLEYAVGQRAAAVEKKNPTANDYWGPDAIAKNLPNPLRRLLWAGQGEMDAPVAPEAAQGVAPVNPRIAQGVAALQADPSTAGLSFDEILAQGHGNSLSPEELQEFQMAWGQ